MRYAHIIARFAGSFWLIREEALVAIVQLLEARINAPESEALLLRSKEQPESEIDRDVAAFAGQGIALIDVKGTLGKRLSTLEQSCGGCDYDVVVDEVESALSLPQFRAAVLRINSPGGMVVGCAEAAKRLGELCAASDKPVVAFTETQCASGAYWLAAACDAIYATESAIVGSTGAKSVIRDDSEKYAKEGVRFHVFKSGTMKDLGAPYRAPTSDEISFMQARADAIGATFRASVVSHRPGVAPEVFTTAAIYSGEDVVRLGLVDQLVASVKDVVALLEAPRV